MGELHTPCFNSQLSGCVGDVLMFFLPGLLGAMQDIAKGDQKQAHAITCVRIESLYTENFISIIRISARHQNYK
jgi:hypothetical protein